MTEAETRKEWAYRYQERLGMICGSDKPTPEMEDLARREANEAILEIADREAKEKR